MPRMRTKRDARKSKKKPPSYHASRKHKRRGGELKTGWHSKNLVYSQPWH